MTDSATRRVYRYMYMCGSCFESSDERGCIQTVWIHTCALVSSAFLHGWDSAYSRVKNSRPRTMDTDTVSHRLECLTPLNYDNVF